MCCGCWNSTATENYANHFTVQRELEKVTDLRRQLITLANREEAAKNELLELKKKTEKSAAEFQQKMNTIQKEKLKLEDCIQEVSHCDSRIF